MIQKEILFSIQTKMVFMMMIGEPTEKIMTVTGAHILMQMINHGMLEKKILMILMGMVFLHLNIISTLMEMVFGIQLNHLQI